MKSKLKLLHISDLHCSPIDIDPSVRADYMIVSGDLTNYGKLDEFEVSITILLDLCSNLNIPKLILTGGNHDSLLELAYGRAKIEEYLTRESTQRGIQSIICLDEAIELSDGTKVFVSSYYRRIGIGSYWPFSYSDQMTVDLFNQIPKDTQILITHGPPFNVLDGEDKYGCPLLFDFIAQSSIKLHLFGHIHEGFGNTKLSGRHYYNSSLVSHLIDLSLIE